MDSFKGRMINLHAHSRYSDGHDSIAVMALEMKKLGHCCAVITDHVYSLDVAAVSGEVSEKEPMFSMSPRAYRLARAEAEALLELSGFPVIIGIELSIKGYEEVVVIGTSAIKKIYELREKKGFITIDDLANVRVIHNCLINLCHPMNAERFTSEGGHKVIDCYEYIHSGTEMFRDTKEDLYAQYGIIPLANSDSHWSKSLYRCCNVLDEPVQSEMDLINYFRQRRGGIGHHVEPRRENQENINAEDIF
jgi:hypothetical protein